MFVNYFDLGLYTGNEMSWMLKGVLPHLDIDGYRAYGFEACVTTWKKTAKRFRKHDNVLIMNLAIAQVAGPVKFYHCFEGASGNSIFDSKNNINPENYDLVPGVVFSEWVVEMVPSFKEDFNVLRFNIEGAEWHLFNDLEKSGIIKHIDVFCGAKPGKDMAKISEIKNKVDQHIKIFNDYKIKVFPFADHRENTNKLRKIISRKLKEKQT